MSKKQTFKCDWYGKEFEEYASNRRNDKKFCSLSCYGLYKRRVQVFKCDYCGIKFERRPSQKHGEKNYCSKECYALGRHFSSYHTYTCATCGEEFGRYASEVHSKNVYCSKECFRELLKEKRGPRKNWDYRSERMKNFGSIPKDLRSCYLKEARAMLEGKDTYGKNKCVELPEESSQTMKIVIAREERCAAVN